jgi:hypothetical protein
MRNMNRGGGMERLLVMKRLLVAIAAMVCAGALAGTVGAVANPNSAAGLCGPPGQTFNKYTPNPVRYFEHAPGELTQAFCAPGHL